MKIHPALVPLALLAAPLAASDLTLNGATTAQVPYGSAVQIGLTGAPGAPALVFLDVDPGPIPFDDEFIPIGGTPLLTLLYATSIPPTGTSFTNFPIPVNPGLSGETFYIAAVVADPLDSNGLDFSNAGVLEVIPPAGAGENITTLIGRGVTLDGSAAADPSGAIPAGTSVFWDVLSQPAGSTASLDHALTLFPSIVPDVIGDYVVRQTVSAGGATTEDTMTIHAYDLTLAAPFDGTWINSPLYIVLGDIQGPSLGALRLNGVDVAVDGSGNFGPINQSFAPDEVFGELAFAVVDADGSEARERYSTGQGQSSPLTQATPKSIAAHLGGSGLDQLEALAAGEFSSVDVQSLLTALGPQQIANDEGLWGFTIFSAIVEFKTLTFNTNDVTVQLTPTPSGVFGMVSLNNVNATFDVWGELLEIPYSLTGSMSTNPVDISGTMLFTAQGGQIGSSISNVNVVRHNFNFNLDGFLGSVAELFVIEDTVKSDVEAAVADVVATELPAAVAELLNEFELAVDLFDLLEVDVQIAAPITGVVHSSDGVTIQLDGLSTVGVPEPGSPPVTTYRTTQSPPPSFGALTPGGQTFGAALAASDDFLNQALAAATAGGLLNGDPSELLAGIDTGEKGENPADLLVTDALGTLFPGAGFEHFPSGTMVGLRAEATMPPVVTTTPGGPSLGLVEITDLVIDFTVPVPGGDLPMLSVALNGSAELALSVELDGTLSAGIENLVVSATVLQGFPGSSLDLLQSSIDFLALFLLPTLTEGLDAIPLPELAVSGFGVLPTEVVLVGTGSQYVGFYGDLVLSSPAP